MINLNTILESLLFGGPIPAQAPLPAPPEKRVANPVQVKAEIKYTVDGVPYVEADLTGSEVSAWNLINADTAKGVGRSKLGTSDEISEGVAKGFSAETVAIVRLHWSDGKKQAAIAKATGLSLDTVKKITPIFSKGVKGKT